MLRSAEGEFLTFARTHREDAEDCEKLPEFLALSLLGAPRHTWPEEVHRDHMTHKLRQHWKATILQQKLIKN